MKVVPLKCSLENSSNKKVPHSHTGNTELFLPSVLHALNFLKLGRLALQIAQVVQLRAAHFTAADNLST